MRTKSTHLIRRLLSCCLLAWGCAAQAASPQQDAPERGRIVWSVIDWPPYMILKDGHAPASAQDLGVGVADRMLAELIPLLPQYQHEFQASNSQRLWPAMQRGQNTCYPMAAKSAERQAFAYFTPSSLLAPQSLVFHAKQREALAGSGNPVSLVKLMREHPEQGLLLEQRAYGAQLDALIAVHGQGLKRELMAKGGTLLRPLSAGLFGYTLEYPIVIEYAKRQGDLAGAVETASIAEAQDWVPGHIACTRNAWGRQAIADIDAAIRKASLIPAYRQAVALWLPADYAQRYAERMRAFYDARAKGGPQID